MVRPVQRIQLRWRLHPDDLLRGQKLLVPELSVRLQETVVFGRTKAILAPFGRCTVFPLFIARELGLAQTELGTPFQDPLLPHLTLWLWREAQAIEVYGESLGDHLECKVPVAFDSSEKLDSVLLGQQFFHAVHLQLDVKGESTIELT